MAFTDDEKGRITFHLGYPQTDANFAVGALVETPLNRQQYFLLAIALEHTTPVCERTVRQLLQAMDDLLFSQVPNATDLVEATRISDINPNQNVLGAKMQFYRMWGRMMANTLGCVPWPHSPIYRTAMGSVRGYRVRSM